MDENVIYQLPDCADNYCGHNKEHELLRFLKVRTALREMSDKSPSPWGA